MAHTFKTDPWHVKEARGAASRSSEFAREHSPYTKARRDIAKRIRARERREMERIARDMEAWGDTARVCDRYQPSRLAVLINNTERQG